MIDRVFLITPEGNKYMADRSIEKHRPLFDKMIDRFVKELKYQDRFTDIIFYYDTLLKGNTVGLITKRGEIFRSVIVFNDNFSNGTQVYYNVLNIWNSLEKEYWKPQAEGVFNNKSVKFNKVFDGYEFSDEEVKDLLNGNIVEFVNSKDEIYVAKLDDLQFNNFRYYGVKVLKKIPRVLCDVKLTDEQRQALKDGLAVKISGMINRYRKPMSSCYVSIDENGEYIFDFDRVKRERDEKQLLKSEKDIVNEEE